MKFFESLKDSNNNKYYIYKKNNNLYTFHVVAERRKQTNKHTHTHTHTRFARVCLIFQRKVLVIL